MDSSLACYEGKLVYVANLRVPSEKAHVLQSFKMCEAFRRHMLNQSNFGACPVRC